MASYSITGGLVRVYTSELVSGGKGNYAYRCWGTLTTTEYDDYVAWALVGYVNIAKSSSAPTGYINGTYTASTGEAGGVLDPLYSGGFGGYPQSDSGDQYTIVNTSGTITKEHFAFNVTFALSFSSVFTTCYPSGQSYTKATASSGSSVTLTVPAKSSYSISYNANGGMNAPAGQTKWYGENIALQSAKPTRNGYMFRYWNTAANGSGTTYQPGATYTGNAPLSLYAIWQQVPTCDATATSSAPYYNGKPSYTVSVSNTHVYGGASISSINLVLGSQSAGRTSAGSISVTPPTAGTFTPRLTITDSIGASTTYYLDPIIVKQYVQPSVAISAERTTTTGVPSEDESTANNCLLTVAYTFCDDAYSITSAPEVTVTDDDGLTTTPTVTWFSTRDSSTGAVSGSVTWSNLSSGDTVYGLITGLSVLYPYQIGVTPSDNRSTGTTKNATLPPLFYTIDFLAGGHGIAMGKASTDPGFECAMNATFESEVYIDLPDYQVSGSTDKALYDAIVALGWQNDVIV